ncbi:hypothetical protein N7495_003839 [Penicillium taxi]|uniref:uncharacterized protein n=1 Tax=Penicillium taxi TaxID=168475 RepID=UPI002544ED18|nr:uncharacterized protein N7495_003839 [Penicillium taxi]KAJ5899095.1 hypothetical protein N7495_003839 [Penicillium taxi]
MVHLSVVTSSPPNLNIGSVRNRTVPCQNAQNLAWQCICTLAPSSRYYPATQYPGGYLGMDKGKSERQRLSIIAPLRRTPLFSAVHTGCDVARLRNSWNGGVEEE